MAGPNIVSAGEMSGLGSATAFGLKVLGLVITIEMAREMYKSVRGAHGDFAGVAMRGVVAAIVLSSIPWLSLTLSSMVIQVAEVMMSEATTRTIDKSFTTAIGNFGCEEVSGWDAMRLLVTPSGWLAILASGVVAILAMVKMVIIDVMWPLFFTLVVYLGVISVPINFSEDMGGMKIYARNVISIALWPIVFAFCTSLVSAMFPRIIGAVASGTVSVDCGAVMAMPAGEGAAGDDLIASTWGVAKYIAVCIGLIILTLKTPTMAAMVVGSDSPSSLAKEMIATIKR